MADQLDLGSLIYKLGFSNEKEFLTALENQFKQAEKIATAEGKKAGEKAGAETAKSFSQAFGENIKAGRGFFSSLTGALETVRKDSADKGREAGSDFVKEFKGGLGSITAGAFLGNVLSNAFSSAVSATKDFVDSSANEYARYDAGLNQLRISADTNLPAAQARIKAISEEAKVFSETDISGTVGSLIQSGLSGAQALEAVQQGAILAAGSLDPVTGKFADLNATSVGLATVTRALGLDFSKTAETSDVLALAAQKSGTNIEGMVASISPLGGLAQITNTGLTDLGASIGYLTNIGFQATEAQTGLNTVMNSLLSPTGKLKAQADSLGLSFVTSTGQTRPFMEVIKNLGRVANEGGVGAKFLKEVGLDTYALKVAVALGKGSNEVAKFKGELENAGGSAQRLADISRNGLPGSLKASEVAAANARKELGESLEPAITSVSHGLAETVKAGSSFIRHFGEYAPILAIVTGAVGTLSAAIFGPAALSVAIAAIGPIATTAGTVVAAAFGPAGIAALAIAGLAGYITSLFVDIKKAEDEVVRLDAERARLIATDPTGRLAAQDRLIDLRQQKTELQQDIRRLQTDADLERRQANEKGQKTTDLTPAEKVLKAKREELDLTLKNIEASKQEVELAKQKAKENAKNKPPASTPNQPRPDLSGGGGSSTTGYATPSADQLARARDLVNALLDAKAAGKGIAEAQANLDRFTKSSKSAAQAVKEVTAELTVQRQQAKQNANADETERKRVAAEQKRQAEEDKRERERKAKELADTRKAIAGIESDAAFTALIKKSTEAQLLSIIAEEKRLAAQAKTANNLTRYNLVLARTREAQAQLNVEQAKQIELLGQLAEAYRNGEEFRSRNERFQSQNGQAEVAQSQRVRLLAEQNRASDEQVRSAIESTKTLLANADAGLIALSVNARKILETNLTVLEARLGDAADRVFALAGRENLAADPSQANGADPLGPTAEAIDESLKRIQDGLDKGLNPGEIQTDAEYIGRLLDKNLVPYEILGDAQRLFAAYLKLLEDTKDKAKATLDDLDEFLAKGNTGELNIAPDVSPETVARLTQIGDLLDTAGTNTKTVNGLLEELAVLGKNPSLTEWADELTTKAKGLLPLLKDIEDREAVIAARGLDLSEFLKGIDIKTLTPAERQMALLEQLQTNADKAKAKLETTRNEQTAGLATTAQVINATEDYARALERQIRFVELSGKDARNLRVILKELQDGLAGVGAQTDEFGRSLDSLPDAKPDISGLQDELAKLAETDLTNPEAVGAGLARIKGIIAEGVPDVLKPLAALVEAILDGAFKDLETKYKDFIDKFKKDPIDPGNPDFGNRSPGASDVQGGFGTDGFDAEASTLEGLSNKVADLKTNLALLREERGLNLATDVDVLASSFALSDAIQKEIDSGLLDIDTVRRLRLELQKLREERAGIIGGIDPGNPSPLNRSPGASDVQGGFGTELPSPAPFDTKGLEQQINSVATGFVTTIVAGIQKGDLEGAFKGALGNVADFFIGELIKGVVGNFAAELAATIAASIAEAAAAKAAEKAAPPVLDALGQVITPVVTGATTGSAGGPVGIAIGAGIGLLVGLLPLLFQSKPAPVQPRADFAAPGGAPSINYTAEANVTFQSGASFADPIFRAEASQFTKVVVLDVLESLKLIKPLGDKTNG